MDIKSLLDKLPETYTTADRELIERAFRVADQAHSGQNRASGEPYINHCLAVAGILADLRVPPAVVSAGLLHDTVEDTDVTLKDIRDNFGDEITILVDGVTKLTTLPRVSRGDQTSKEVEKDEELKKIADRRGEPDPEMVVERMEKSRKYDLVSQTLMKTFLAMGEDVRVVLIKLADRLHNMRTLSHVKESKRRRIAKETLDIFAPLASRLGIWQIKWELEDLGFRYTEGDTYKRIATLLAERRVNRENEMEEIKNKLSNVLNQAGIKSEITVRPKHIYSIHKKMSRKGVPFEMVHDIRGVRIIVPDIPTCYTSLGVIHTKWRPIPGEFDDYIAAPKDNFYQSIHTAVNLEGGKTVEIQIRSPEMHQNAEYGIAAHWRYKEGSPRDDDYERRIIWIRNLMDWRQDVDDAYEFVDGMKSDVFEDRVYVFTPRGDIIDMPAGSTPIDFAYHVHTDIGHRCRGAKINGRLISLDYILKTGDKVEILTAKRGGPSRDWLNLSLGLVKTQRARSKIRRWFKHQARDSNTSQGRLLLEKEMKRLGIQDVSIEKLAREFNYRDVDDFFEVIGTGDLSLSQIVDRLIIKDKDIEEAILIPTPSTLDQVVPKDAISVLGLKGILTKIARCCNPAPGDSIIGYITRGRGATIHLQDCPNILRIKDRERLVRVSWGTPKATFPVPVIIKAYDRDGLMKDVSTLISDEGVNMPRVSVHVDNNLAIFDMIVEVRDISQLSRLLNRLENLPNVVEAKRYKPG